MREICLDTETTGMAAKEGDRIIEIGCVELGEHGLTDKNFHEYIDPERQMEAEVIRVHKITNEFLVGKPKFADIADKFIEFVQGARLIIHNAQFDIGFLNEELRKLGKPSMEEICGKDNIIDSMELPKPHSLRCTTAWMHCVSVSKSTRPDASKKATAPFGRGAFRPGLPRS